jgi:hypothetical protein
MSWVETHDAEFTKRLHVGCFRYREPVCLQYGAPIGLLKPWRGTGFCVGSRSAPSHPLWVTRGVAEDDYMWVATVSGLMTRGPDLQTPT